MIKEKIVTSSFGEAALGVNQARAPTILKGLDTPLTVYLDSKHCGLKQCNDNPTLAIKSCKGNREGVRMSFHCDAFDIKGMIKEKMVTSSFDGATLGVSHARTSRVSTLGAGADLPLRRVRPERHVVLGLACLALGVNQDRVPTWGHLTLGLPCPRLTAGPAPHTARPGRVLML
jgi:hypothetical protein